jgi:hypothetical protein
MADTSFFIGDPDWPTGGERIVDELPSSEADPAIMPFPLTAGLEWRVVEGPTGRGRCLMTTGSDMAVRFLAPPGVPLQLPELAGGLDRWRTAFWDCGFIVGGVEVLKLEKVRERVPSELEWIEEQVREAQRRDLLVQNLPADVAGDEAVVDEDDEQEVLVSALPDRRRIVAVTKSASTFAALVSSLSRDTAFAQVEDVTNMASCREEFDTELDAIGERIGPARVRELAVALLHARARSHSWRYTWFLAWTERRAPLQRVIGREVDRARTSDELHQRLLTVELASQELHQALTGMLYVRSHGFRWRITAPLRRLLGTYYLSSVRTLLRSEVHPRAERLRAQDISPLSHG